ncbi:MAG: cytochrome C oxidase subunit IV family protein [Limisphaerales bacterium]
MKSISATTKNLLTTGALLCLLALTIALAYIDLGPFNAVAAISISVAKASLILLFFMQLRGNSRLIWVAAVTGLVWLAIMFALSLSDFMTRH